MRPLFTASAAERCIACPPSFRLPQSPQEPGEAAQRGTVLHTCVEDALRNGVDTVTLPAWAPRWPLAAVVDAVRRVHGDRRIGLEVPYAIDPLTGEARKLRSGKPREYRGIREGEIAGTADHVSAPKRRVVVSDLKTGRRRVEADSAQMLLLGAAAGRAAGTTDVCTVIIQCPADSDSPEDVVVRAHEADSLELGFLVSDLKRAATYEGEPVEGEHCRFCPASPSCPAKGNAIQRVEALPAITRENAADAWMLLERVKPMISGIEDAIKEALKAGEVDLPDGRSLGMVETVREKISAPIALTVLAERFGPDAVIRAASTSKSGIKKAIPPASERGTYQDVEDEIREKGGISESVSKTLKAIDRT